MISIMKKDFLSIIVFFLLFLLYAVNADYGHRVDNFPYFDNVEVDFDNVGTALERDSINGTEAVQIENPNKWLMRFRLYSVDSDEMNSIMALSRIKPQEFKFDPHHYSYGGGYIYPLGLWFLTLKQVGIIQTGSLEWMINNPQEMNKIYHAGRIFTLFAFFISTLFLYYSLKIIRNRSFAFIAGVIYLSTPSLLMFAMLMKPHVYAMLWTNLSIFILTRAYFLEKFKIKDSVVLGFALGMAVGSAISYALFAIMTWISLLYFVNKGWTRHSKLVITPIVAIIIYFLVNPYVILNYEAFVLEKSAQQSWFFFGSDFNYIWLFFINSLIPGFGFGILALLFYTVLSSFSNFGKIETKLSLFILLLVVSFISSISASVSEWHINSRYVLYLVPVILVLYATCYKSSVKFLSIVAFLTAFQSFPLLLAYYDEDSFVYSTRLQAAKWINNNVPIDASVCTSGKSIAPYDSPPFNFMKTNVDYKDCDFLISVEMRPDQADNHLHRELIKRFEPRFNIKQIPLVYSYINPQISIYRNK